MSFVKLETSATPDKPSVQLALRFSDGSSIPLTISKFTTLRKGVPKVLIHLDRLEDGSCLLIVNEELLPVNNKRELTAKLIRIDVVRNSDTKDAS